MRDEFVTQGHKGLKFKWEQKLTSGLVRFGFN